MERRNAHRVILFDVLYHLNEQRVLEASGVDFAGNVVKPELPPMPVPKVPADPPVNVMLLPLREKHLRDRVYDPVPEVHVLHDPEPAPSDRSSVVARLRQDICGLEGNFEVGVGIPVPDARTST